MPRRRGSSAVGREVRWPHGAPTEPGGARIGRQRTRLAVGSISQPRARPLMPAGCAAQPALQRLSGSLSGEGPVTGAGCVWASAGVTRNRELNSFPHRSNAADAAAATSDPPRIERSSLLESLSTFFSPPNALSPFLLTCHITTTLTSRLFAAGQPPGDRFCAPHCTALSRSLPFGYFLLHSLPLSRQPSRQPHIILFDHSELSAATVRHGSRSSPVQGHVPLHAEGVRRQPARHVHHRPSPGRLALRRHHVQAAALCHPLPRHGQGPHGAVRQALPRRSRRRPRWHPCHERPRQDWQGRHAHDLVAEGPGDRGQLCRRARQP